MSTDRIVITAPHVLYGPNGIPQRKADADYLRSGARHLEGGHKLGGSNLTRTVIDLLINCADQLDRPAEAAPIVIDRAELPAVTGVMPGNKTTAESHRKIALHHLALAEYLDAHPPVDEADVEALTSILGDFAVFDSDGSRRDDILARHLAERGVRVVTR